MTDNIKIYIAYHKKCKVIRGDYLYPIQVGAANSSEHFENMLRDDDGDNISRKNRSYGEMTAQYWAWKNDDADYYGFFHYRRFLSFSDKKYPVSRFEEVEEEYLSDKNIKKLNFTKEHMREIINSYDIITSFPVRLKNLRFSFKNNYKQYVAAKYQHHEDIDLLLEIIKEKTPQYYKQAHRYFFDIPYGYFCNMFIMKKELFQEYCEWVFPLLDEFEKRRDYSNYSIDGERLCGYLGERLFGIFYENKKKSHKYKTLELQRVLFKNAEEIEHPDIKIGKNDVPIVIASNDYYAPYISTLLLSIADYTNIDRNYKIFILTHDMSKDNKIKIEETVKNKENIALDYIDPWYLLDGYDLYTRGHFSVETYYRLVLPELFNTVKKLVYIDVDMIVKADIAELYDTNVEGYLLAAVHDADTAGLYNGFQTDKKEYMDSKMKMKDPYQYFQAGTLVMNLEHFRKTFTTKEILDFSASQKWQLLDQDILNVLCEGKVKFLDMSWNVMYDYASIRLKEIIRLAPRWLYDMYVEARKHPKIIHYAGPEKPWLFPEADFADEYWKYAKRTPYYETMLYRMSSYASNKEKENEYNRKNEERKRKQNPLIKTIRCLRLYGIKHTVNEIKRELAY
ncbi:DUF4422 domain-containing protein [Butyrivibrio sp. NC3005]|uniref:DUF4422 domain-containing protein n=1 Tax=Butyrivibrio sp. NC3005 TaxID=1280685 RepID=UPI0004149817|nr:DUF4422 domain-containing protein [Butyrivibrio sp. NC3005]